MLILVSSYHPPMFSSLIPCFSYVDSVFLLWSLCFLSSFIHCPPMSVWFPSCRSCFPLWSHCSFLISYVDYDPTLSSLMIPGWSCFPHYPHCPPWSPMSSMFLSLSSHVNLVSSLLILMMIAIKFVLPGHLLTDDVLPCFYFMPVSFLCGDYRGWLLIIFILNILLWWYLFLSF